MKYLFFTTLTLAILISCAPKSVEAIADSAETAGTSDLAMTAEMESGKMVFQQKCISCHYGRDADRIPELVDRYSKERWDEILPVMIEKAELNESEERQITSYINWEISN